MTVSSSLDFKRKHAFEEHKKMGKHCDPVEKCGHKEQTQESTYYLYNANK